jgi:hypothetical protein
MLDCGFSSIRGEDMGFRDRRMDSDVYSQGLYKTYVVYIEKGWFQMKENREACVLFSGGTDSTCASVIMSDSYESVTLLTIDRKGFYDVENTLRNSCVLKDKICGSVIRHKFINADKLVEYLNGKWYRRDFFKYGFYVMSNCIFCVLINHFAALLYCLKNGVMTLADGVTREWPQFPSHMEKILPVFKRLYDEFQIAYETPVFDFPINPDYDYFNKIFSSPPGKEPDMNEKTTTGIFLFKRGIFPDKNLKGSDADHCMQPRCFQFTLHHIYLYWYYFAFHNYGDFEKLTLRYMDEKVNDFTEMIRNDRELLFDLIVTRQD